MRYSLVWHNETSCIPILQYTHEPRSNYYRLHHRIYIVILRDRRQKKPLDAAGADSAMIIGKDAIFPQERRLS